MAKTKNQVSLEAGLWNACNKLRGSVSATDYVNVVLGLLFLRFAYDKFNAQREKLLAEEDTVDFVENPRFYSKDNVFFLGENDRWSYIKDHSKSNKIFTYIDDAFRNIEKNNPSLKGALPIGFYITLHIEPSKFSSLIDEIERIQYSQGEADDVIGRVYEYFLKKFCIAAKSEKGEFYTPANIVELMTLLIQPYSGSVYDPCCGSGGMFVQSAEFIKRHQGNKKDITIYGQESNGKTYKLARMNLAIRGLNCDLGDMDASTFISDKHPNLRADFILANPPFNLKNWRTENELKNDSRWDGYEVPPVSNANYAWILHMLARLSYNGTAAFLLANGALGADSEEYKIRKQLIKNNKIEAIIVLPREMFYATDISSPYGLWATTKRVRRLSVKERKLCCGIVKTRSCLLMPEHLETAAQTRTGMCSSPRLINRKLPRLFLHGSPRIGRTFITMCRSFATPPQWMRCGARTGVLSHPNTSSLWIVIWGLIFRQRWAASSKR